MARLYVHTAFNLNTGGEIRRFPIGLHEFSDEEAGHWLVKLNTSSDAPADDASVIASEREALAAERAQLDADRAALAAEREAFEAEKAAAKGK